MDTSRISNFRTYVNCRLYFGTFKNPQTWSLGEPEEQKCKHAGFPGYKNTILWHPCPSSCFLTNCKPSSERTSPPTVLECVDVASSEKKSGSYIRTSYQLWGMAEYHFLMSYTDTDTATVSICWCDTNQTLHNYGWHNITSSMSDTDRTISSLCRSNTKHPSGQW